MRVIAVLFALCLVGFAAEEEVNFKTKDGLTIYGTLGWHDLADQGTRPAIILIHQGKSSRAEWTAFARKCQAKQYITLAYDVRGHGKSDKAKHGTNIFFDPTQTPEDLKAALKFLKANKHVNKDRIAVVGASMGGNLACLAAAEYGIRTAVSISPKTEAVLSLADKKDVKPASVFYVAGELDQSGKRAAWAKELYEKTAEPRRLEVVKGSRGHGVWLLREGEVEKNIFVWLDAKLMVK
ncbi:MAG: alpha/beta hydrolase family protein [Planctomycetota bacterium]|jgi:pimeloyl-ACP methyl ester carboxylesterase